MAKEKILLLDANAIVHRAYHALPPLTSPKGELVNAVYGFALTLLKAIQDVKPDYIVAAFDAGRKTFRDDMYSEYKANRKKTDDELHIQVPRIWHLLEAMSIPVLADEGFEADDLVGALAHMATKKDIESIIVTGDKDTLQLVDDHTKVYSLHRGMSDTLMYDRETVIEKMGVPPEKVVLLKALAGDSSDNIPGVPGIGPKTAVELITKYKDGEGIYKNLDKLKPRTKELLEKNKDKFELSEKLAQIITNIKIDLDFEKASVKHFDFTKAASLFAELGFKSLITRLPRSGELNQAELFSAKISQSSDKKPDGTMPCAFPENVEDWHNNFYPKIKGSKYLAIDTETIDLHGELIGISFAWSENDTVYLPLAPATPGGLPIDKVRHDIEDILIDKEIKKIGHNLKYDIKILKNSGFKVENLYFDTMIASALINSQLYSQKLDDLALIELNYKKIPITDLIGAKADKTLEKVDIATVAQYSCEDAVVTFRLYKKLFPDLEAKHLKKIFYEIEMPLIEILMKMEERGVKIDIDHFKKINKKMSERLVEIKKEAYKLAGEEFNLSSPAQLKVILFDKLKISSAGIKKTGKQGLSTDAESLAKIEDKHPLVKLILENRELAKLVNTYVKALPELADKNDKIHTSFNQNGAITGRLSSNNPNLQNIPIKTELGTDVRRGFIADEGKIFLSADYSQAELRIVAHLSGDKGLQNAFTDGGDVHTAVANELGIERRTAKAINFGIIYGLGPLGIAEDLKIDIADARKFYDSYFERFPHVRNFIDKTKSIARDQGFVETILGRRRYLPDIHSPNSMLRSSAERMAVNMPAQGSVADLMKMAMIEVEEIEEAELLLQIHDELLLQVTPDKAKKVGKMVKEIMENLVKLDVPMEATVKTGKNWADLEEIKV